MANKSYGKVVLDSIGPNAKRLVTVECRYWRAIHAEIMTHRDRARNAASSRAIPFFREAVCKLCNGTTDCISCGGNGLSVLYKEQIAEIGGVPTTRVGTNRYNYAIPNCTYSMIWNDPFIPEFIGTEQKGMQSGGELLEPYRGDFLKLCHRGREYMLEVCLEMFKTGVHKSIINRYLEPWSYITVIMTATEWNNFFRLRVHPKAEKHFNKVASQIKEAMGASRPLLLGAGDWHLPYLRGEDWNSPTGDLDFRIRKTEREIERGTVSKIAVLKRVSAGRCARLSYLTHEGIREQSKDLDLFESLIHPKLDEDRDDDVIHSSPLEHVAEASNGEIRSGPYDGWFQFRKEFPNECVPG